jgi:hypothetical protein
MDDDFFLENRSPKSLTNSIDLLDDQDQDDDESFRNYLLKEGSRDNVVEFVLAIREVRAIWIYFYYMLFNLSIRSVRVL